MSERIKPFEGGTQISYTCIFGLRGQVKLNKPEGITQEAFKNYLQINQKACEQCAFSAKHVCLGIESNGVGYPDTLGKGGLLSQLRKLEAPCFSEQPFFPRYKLLLDRLVPNKKS